MEESSKINPDIDSSPYRTPFYPPNLPPARFHLSYSHIFYKKSKLNKNTSDSQSANTPKPHSRPISKKAGLVTLAQWLRWSAVNMGVSKHVYDVALALLTQSSQKMDSTYALAAASLVIAAKLQHGPIYFKNREIPSKSTATLPKVTISDAIKVEGILLNTLDFSIPIPSCKLQLLLSLTQHWNNFILKREKKINIPLHFLQAGLQGSWQKRNLTCVGYLLDLLSVGASGHSASDKIYLIAALVVVCAENICQTQQIANDNFIMVKLAKIFLKKFYKVVEEQEHKLMLVLTGVVKYKLYQKLSLVPQQKEEEKIKIQTQEQKLQWLNKLNYIPFSSQSHDIFKK